ncbi:hypothetical protein [uncultured Rhodospira sp.]|uniref:hypothetical protein n=1 Tax=uncultured Rhodospira sp. TaxID=1936189 RepID=UPI002603F7B4|nr:hypothetical protein [uncultured Rhodospira sp.]
MNIGSGHVAFRVPIEFLCWPQRMKGEDGTGRQSIIAKPNMGWQKHFANWLLHLDRTQNLGVLEDTVEQFFKDNENYVQWWRGVLASADIRVEIFNAEPRIPLDRLRVWRFAMSRLDPDALLTLAIADQAPGSPHGSRDLLKELENWRVFPAIAHPDLDVLVARGVADTHVHLEASDPIPVLWSRLVIGDVALEHVPRYSYKELEGIKDNTERRDKRLEELCAIRRALEWRSDVIRSGSDVFSSIMPPSLDQRTWRSLDLLREERLFLLTCWRSLKQNDGALDAAFQANFDQYLYAKSRFLREQTQFPESGGGLQRFRQYLDRGEPLSEKRGSNRSISFMRARLVRQATMALECPHLRRLELRIAPRKTFKDWVRFFKVWESAYEQLGRREEDIRFIVHFIRDAKIRGDQPQYWALRKQMDRRTALLHLFRHEDQREAALSEVFGAGRRVGKAAPMSDGSAAPDDVPRAPLARWIVGLDVANLERGCPPSVMIPFLKVLQGDFSLLDDSDRMPLEYWDRLKARGLHTHAFSLPRLRQTYHAGEDFFHLVTGLRHIDVLIDSVLQARDRIGHGLALGLDPNLWLTRNQGRVQVQNGVALDDLVWIRQVGREVNALRPGDADELERAALRLSRQIHGMNVSLADLQDAALERRKFPPRIDAADLSPAREIVQLECWNQAVSNRMVMLADSEYVDLLDKQIPILRDVQKHLCDKIARKGIYIEINPSSNLVTGHVQFMTEHPMHSISRMSEGRVRLTVNTDDPGVFATRIDQEFALVLDSLLQENEQDIPRVMDFLDKMRRRGLESCFTTIQPFKL